METTEDMVNTIRSETHVGLENGLIKALFSRKTGALVSLVNQKTGTDLIREYDPRGNLFRLYVDSSSPMLEAEPYDPGDGRIVEPALCAVSNLAFEEFEDFGRLVLSLHHEETGLGIELEVELHADGNSIDVGLEVTNQGQTSQSVRAALPYLSGLGIDPNRDRDLALALFDRGFPGDEAWTERSAVYGKEASMQWQCVYNADDSEGLAFIAMDSNFRTKVLSRFKRGMQAWYADSEVIAAGGNHTWPRSRIVVYTGSWRIAARAYGEWFRQFLKPRPVPKWYRSEVTMRSSDWFPTADEVRKSQERESGSRAIRSYRDFPMLYLDDVNDLKEHAMWNQDVVLWPEIYGPWMSAGFVGFREDLGGRKAFIDGVKAVHRLGRRVAMYVAGYGIRKNSPLFARGSWRDFASLGPEGNELTGGYVEGIFCCHGYKHWQDNIVSVCTMLAETGIDEIRLDELGMPFKPCFNPVHGHSSPYDSVAWSVDLVRRVREAVEKINPDFVITTEFYCDAYHVYTNGALVMGYAGTGIDVMRVALPGYLAISYHAGCAEAAITGSVPARVESLRAEWPWEILPFAGKPDGHPDDTGERLRWPEILGTFSDAILHGLPMDEDPQAPSAPHWKGHIWLGAGYRVLVGGFDDGTRLDRDFIKVILPKSLPNRLPEDLPATQCAYEFDAETLEMSKREIFQENGERVVHLHHQVSALFLPDRNCKSLVVAQEVSEEVRPGGTLVLNLDTIDTWSRSDVSIQAAVQVPGCIETPITTAFPASLEIKIPETLSEGWYHFRVDGDVLPFKRWFRISTGISQDT